MYMHQKNYKKGEFSPSHFCQNTLYYIQGDLSNFGSTLKIYEKSNFDRNQLKFSMQHKNLYMYQKNKCTDKKLSTMPKSCGKPCCPLY